MDDESTGTDGESSPVAGPSSSRVHGGNAPAASGSSAADHGDDDADWDETVEESLLHVTLDNADDVSNVNAASNVRVIAIETDSPALQIENKMFRFNEWKYIPGTAMFFEKSKDVKIIDPLYDNRCGSVFQYVGSTRKCLEMTKKDTV